MLDAIFQKRASLENPSTPLSSPAAWLYEALGIAPNTANVTVNDKTVLQITAFWSAVNTISDTLATLPIRLVQSKRNGTRKIIQNHDALDLLTYEPNPFMAAVVAKAAAQAHTLVRGNSYCWIKRARSQRLREMWPLDPTVTRPVVKDRKLYFSTRTDAGQLLLPAADVVHVPGFTRDGIVGLSVVAEQREALAHTLALNQFGSKFFANGAKPGGLVSFDSKIRDPEKIRKALREQYTGENVHGLLVLDNGAKFTPFAIPPEDAQFLQTKEFSVDDIGRMFRLPAHFLNKMGQATFNNLEQMGSHFVQYTMVPWLARWEQELTRKLLTEQERGRNMRFKFVTAGLMRGDIKTRASVYASAVQNGWMTRNEVRAFEEMNPLPGLDEPLTPKNMDKGDGKDKDEDKDPADEGDKDDKDKDKDDEIGADVDAAEKEGKAQRAALVMQSMCDRLAVKEANAVRSALCGKLAFKDGMLKLESFYQRHAQHIEENLALPADVAQEYCQRAMKAAAAHADPQAYVSELPITAAASLLDIATRNDYE